MIKSSYENLFSIIYESFIFGTLILALYRYCADKLKYRLLSKRLFQRKKQRGG